MSMALGGDVVGDVSHKILATGHFGGLKALPILKPAGAFRRVSTDRVRKVLLVEDNPADVRLVSAMLAESGPIWHLESTPRLSVALHRLSLDRFDAVLLDLGLPDSRGF